MALLGALFFAGRASAFVNPTWFQELPPSEQEVAVDFFYEQSPQGMVPYTGEAAEISESVSDTYEAETDSEPFYSDLVGDVNEVGQADKLFPPIEDAVPEIAAASGAFAVGWKIGEGLNSIFADVGLGEHSVPEPLGVAGYSFCYSAECGGELHWENHGSTVYYEGMLQQSPGAYTYAGRLMNGAQMEARFSPVRWFEEPCVFSDFSPPPYSTLEEGVVSEAECGLGYGKTAPLYIDYPYVTAEQLLSLERFHHYDALLDGTPGRTSKAPEDPGTALVEAKAAERLDESEIDQAFFTQTEQNVGKAEPDYEYLPAPTATEKKIDDEQRRCDRGVSTFTNLGGNESPEPFEVKEPAAFTITSLPPGVESPSPVYLRWGEAEWTGEKREEPEFFDLWGGWGYRHIAAKHGWNALDRLETEEALDTPQKPLSNGGLRWRYSAPDETAGAEGVKCERVVIVQFAPGENKKTKEDDSAPRGIVSSFNQVVPEEK